MDKTVRTLYLLRHAEAVTGSPDNERKLTPEGKAVARKLGLVMRERKYKPASVFCSTARRTKETLDQLGLFSKVSFRDDVYGASAAELLGVLQHAGDTPGLLMVGHNPAIHQLAVALAGDGDINLLRSLHVAFTPATLAVMTLKGPWAQLGPGTATLTSLIIP